MKYSLRPEKRNKKEIKNSVEFNDGKIKELRRRIDNLGKRIQQVNALWTKF